MTLQTASTQQSAGSLRVKSKRRQQFMRSAAIYLVLFQARLCR